MGRSARPERPIRPAGHSYLAEAAPDEAEQRQHQHDDQDDPENAHTAPFLEPRLLARTHRKQTVEAPVWLRGGDRQPPPPRAAEAGRRPTTSSTVTQIAASGVASATAAGPSTTPTTDAETITTMGASPTAPPNTRGLIR